MTEDKSKKNCTKRTLYYFLSATKKYKGLAAGGLITEKYIDTTFACGYDSNHIRGFAWRRFNAGTFAKGDFVDCGHNVEKFRVWSAENVVCLENGNQGYV